MPDRDREVIERAFDKVARDTKPICSVDGCNGVARGRGLCNLHYKRWRRLGDPEATLQQQNKSKECQVIGCEDSAVTKGYCRKHYQRLRRTGSLDDPESISNKGRVCDVEDCEQPAHARGFCVSHYAKFNRYGDPMHTPQSRVRPTCKLEDCQDEARSHGLCLTHYQWARYSSRHEHLIPAGSRAPRCLINGCQEPQYARGLCRSHDGKENRGSALTEQLEADISLFTTGERIRALRIERGWTLRDLAERTGVRCQAVSAIERSNSRSAKTLKKYAEALGVNTSTLLPPAALSSPSVSERYYTPQEVADLLRVTTPTIYRLVKRGALSSLKVGGTYRIPQDAISGLATTPDDNPYEGDEE